MTTIPYIPYLTPFVVSILPQLGAVGLLIVGALFSGLLVAVKTKTFEWRRLADFVTDMVVPYVGGYVLVAALSYFIVPSVVPEGIDFVGKAASGGVFSFVTLSLAGRIYSNFKDLGLPANEPPASR